MRSLIIVSTFWFIVCSPGRLVSWLMVPRCYTVIAGEPDIGVPFAGSLLSLGTTIHVLGSQVCFECRTSYSRYTLVPLKEFTWFVPVFMWMTHLTWRAAKKHITLPLSARKSSSQRPRPLQAPKTSHPTESAAKPAALNPKS